MGGNRCRAPPRGGGSANSCLSAEALLTAAIAEIRRNAKALTTPLAALSDRDLTRKLIGNIATHGDAELRALLSAMLIIPLVMLTMALRPPLPITIVMLTTSTPSWPLTVLMIPRPTNRPRPRRASCLLNCSPFTRTPNVPSAPEG